MDEVLADGALAGGPLGDDALAGVTLLQTRTTAAAATAADRRWQSERYERMSSSAAFSLNAVLNGINKGGIVISLLQ